MKYLTLITFIPLIGATLIVLVPKARITLINFGTGCPGSVQSVGAACVAVNETGSSTGQSLTANVGYAMLVTAPQVRKAATSLHATSNASGCDSSAARRSIRDTENWVDLRRARVSVKPGWHREGTDNGEA